MLSLLSAAGEYIDCFKGIRISTRPDCIDAEILKTLKNYCVTAIELGAQSMCDDVLFLNDRGHNSDAVKKASELVHAHGFSLGLQMMTGLFGSTYEKDVFTAEEFIKLRPDTVRIYPTVILKNTKLEKLYLSGDYIPYELIKSVDLCAELIRMFEQNDIKIIRVGLHSSETMESSIAVDNYHPAFRELCENKIYYDLFLKKVKDENINKGNLTAFVSESEVSKFTGQRKSNLIRLREKGYDVKVVASENLSDRQLIIEEG